MSCNNLSPHPCTGRFACPEVILFGLMLHEVLVLNPYLPTVLLAQVTAKVAISAAHSVAQSARCLFSSCVERTQNSQHSTFKILTFQQHTPDPKMHLSHTHSNGLGDPGHEALSGGCASAGDSASLKFPVPASSHSHNSSPKQLRMGLLTLRYSVIP
jgi:hypothetical protein